MGNESNIILIVLTGTMIMLTLILVIIIFVVTYNKKMQTRINTHKIAIKNKELELLKSVIETQESEREKIAANLHDEVGPLLSALKLRVTKFKRDFQKNKLSGEQFDEEREFIDSIINNVRTVSHDLSPHFLLKFGIGKSLENFAINIEQPKILIQNNLEEKEILARSVVTNSYRVVLELINNIIKHDNAKELTISIKKGGAELTFQIHHDGRGITKEQFNEFADNSKGLGLNSIQSRIIILNANLEFRIDNDEPKVELIIPLNKL